MLEILPSSVCVLPDVWNRRSGEKKLWTKKLFLKQLAEQWNWNWFPSQCRSEMSSNIRGFYAFELSLFGRNCLTRKYFLYLKVFIHPYIHPSIVSHHIFMYFLLSSCIVSYLNLNIFRITSYRIVLNLHLLYRMYYLLPNIATRAFFFGEMDNVHKYLWPPCGAVALERHWLQWNSSVKLGRVWGERSNQLTVSLCFHLCCFIHACVCVRVF